MVGQHQMFNVTAGSPQGDWLDESSNPSERLTQGWVIFYGYMKVLEQSMLQTLL